MASVNIFCDSSFEKVHWAEFVWYDVSLKPYTFISFIIESRQSQYTDDDVELSKV